MRVNNMAVLTGDIHSSWAMDVATDPFNPAVYDPAAGRRARSRAHRPGRLLAGASPEVEAQLPEILRLNPRPALLQPLEAPVCLLDGAPNASSASGTCCPLGASSGASAGPPCRAAWLTRRASPPARRARVGRARATLPLHF